MRTVEKKRCNVGKRELNSGWELGGQVSLINLEYSVEASLVAHGPCLLGVFRGLVLDIPYLA